MLRAPRELQLFMLNLEEILHCCSNTHMDKSNTEDGSVNPERKERKKRKHVSLLLDTKGDGTNE